MKVNSNIQAMFAQTILSANEEKMAKSTQKMSSGYKINRAMDNPAGIAITNRMKAQLKSLDRANKNTKNAVNAVQTAEGALAEIEDMLQRMNELSIQASNGTMTSQDRDAVQEEIDQLTSEISRISKTTTYNTQNLLDGSSDYKGYSSNPDEITVRNYNEQFPQGKYQVSVAADGVPTLKEITGYQADGITPITQNVTCTYNIVPFYDENDVLTGTATTVYTRDGGELTIEKKGAAASTADLDISGYGGMRIQTGTEEGHEIQIIIPEVSLRTLNFIDLDGERTIDCSTQKGAQKAIDKINSAIDYVSAARSKIGAYQNRLENTISNLDVTTENLTESYSTIKDIDMAEGMVEYTTLQVLLQAGTSMLAQSNEQPQQALQLLQ